MLGAAPSSPHPAPHKALAASPGRESTGARRPGTSFPSHGLCFLRNSLNFNFQLCASAVAALTSKKSRCSPIHSTRSLRHGCSASSLRGCRRFFKQAASPQTACLEGGQRRCRAASDSPGQDGGWQGASPWGCFCLLFLLRKQS